LVPVHAARVDLVPGEPGFLQGRHAARVQFAALAEIPLAVGPQTDAVAFGVFFRGFGPAPLPVAELRQVGKLLFPLRIPTRAYRRGHVCVDVRLLVPGDSFAAVASPSLRGKWCGRAGFQGVLSVTVVVTTI